MYSFIRCRVSLCRRVTRRLLPPTLLREGCERKQYIAFDVTATLMLLPRAYASGYACLITPRRATCADIITIVADDIISRRRDAVIHYLCVILMMRRHDRLLIC